MYTYQLQHHGERRGEHGGGVHQNQKRVKICVLNMVFGKNF